MTEKKNNRFLLVELIRRDFIKKYKRTTLGILWSALAPLFLLISMFDKKGENEEYVEILRNHTERFIQSHGVESGGEK